MCCFCMMWELVDPKGIPNEHVCSKCWLLEELRLRVDELDSELRTLRHFREGESYLDSVFQETVTPLRLTNSAGGQGQEGVAANEAGSGKKKAGSEIQKVELQEPQSLNLYNRFEILAPSVDGNGDCKEDEQTAHGTVV